jgi:predicted nucleic acid-binding protein
MSYVDTSIIVAALDPLDSRQALALRALEEKNNKKVSELVLVELANVLAKKEKVLLEISRELSLRKELVIPVAILYIMKRFKLSYRKVESFEKVLGIGDLYLPLASAINISSTFKLKTLDLLHLSYIRTLIEQGEEINEVMTVDEDFEKEAELIKQKINIEVKILAK